MTFNSSFKDSLDIANRACDALGVRRIKDIDEDSRQNNILSSIYDKARQFELRRNVWRFAKRRVTLRAIDKNTMRIVPQAYDSTALYLPGSIVTDTNGDTWVSFAFENQGNTPGVNDVWEPYYGPLSVDLWKETVAYSIGELVYVPTSQQGAFIVYLSLVNANSSEPDVASDYDSTTTYTLDDVVTSGGQQWRSVISYNLGNTPAEAASDWTVSTSYSIGDQATASDGFIYTSSVNTNVGNDPAADDGTHWTRTGVYAWEGVPAQQASASTWRPIYANVQPIGLEGFSASANDQRATYLLPSGYLREALLDPNMPAFPQYRNVYGDFMDTYENPLILAFVADVTKVGRMDTMFCEMLALRMAEMACEPITQALDKQAKITQDYTRFGFEARQVNAIEGGSEEPELDNYIAVRYSDIPWLR